MFTIPARCALLALCLVVPSPRSTAQSFKLPAISFTGAPAFQQSDLLKVSGLQPGATSTQAEIQAAAQHLSDTGLFADVHFESNAKGLVFSLKPMPADNMLPATFANFVWWTTDELTAALKSRVPLYIGSVPISGNIQDAVTAALKALVAEKGVKDANILPIPQAQPGATPTAIAFIIDSPPVRIHSLAFASVSPAMQPKLADVILTQAGQPFDNLTRSTLSSKLLDIYHNEGYLDATLADLTHGAPQITPTGVDVDLTATLQEGEPYTLTQLAWAGSDIMSSADFAKNAKIKPGDVASQLAIRQSIAPLARAYYAKGFQDVHVQAPATLDRATHHVTYTIRVIPGEQYRIRTIKAVGLSDDQRKDFDSAWHMKPGDFYDINYMTEFLTHNRNLQSLRGFSASYKAYSNPNDHLVDLVITFAKGGTLIKVD